MQQRIDQGFEKAPISTGEKSRRDLINNLPELRIRIVILFRVIALRLQLIDLLSGQAEEEEVIGSHLFPDLDVGAIERSNC